VVYVINRTKMITLVVIVNYKVCHSGNAESLKECVVLNHGNVKN